MDSPFVRLQTASGYRSIQTESQSLISFPIEHLPGAHALPAGGRGDMCREAKQAENYYSFIPSTGVSVPTSVLDTGLRNKEERDAVVLSYIPFQMRGGGRRAEAGLWQGYSPVRGTRGREGAILQEGRGIRATLYGEGETSAES